MHWHRLVTTTLVCMVCLPQCWSGDSNNAWIVDQAIPSLVRFNMKGQLVSSDLSDYVKFRCEGEGVARSCEIDQSNLDIWDFRALFHPASTESIQSYTAGVLLYGAVGWAAAVLIVFFTVLYLIVRTCYCTVCSAAVKKRKRRDTSLYPFKLRFVWVIALMAALIVAMWTLVITSYTLGASQALTSISAVPDALYGIANIAYRFGLALQPTFIGIVSTVLLHTLRNVNETLCAAINWESVIIDLVNLNNTVVNLPDFRAMSHSLADISSENNGVNDDIDAVIGDNAVYKAQEVVVRDRGHVLVADLEELQSAMDALSPTVTTGHSVVHVFSADYVTFFGAAGPEFHDANDTSGRIDSTEYDIHHAVRDDNAGEGITTTATLADAASGGSNSVQALLDSDLDGDTVGLTALVSKLRSIYLNLVKLPDFNATADNLEGINTKIADMLTSGAELDDMSDFLTAVQTNLDALPDTAQISTNATTFFIEARLLSVKSTKSHIDHMNSNLDDITNHIDTMIAEIDKLSSSIRSILPPLYDLIVMQPANFNRTIYKVPDTTAVYDSIKVAVQACADEADVIAPELRELNDALRNILDMVDFTTSLLIVDDNLDQRIEDMDEPGMLAAIDAGSIDTTFNTSASKLQLTTFRTALENAEVPTSVITAFRDLQIILADLETQLKQVAALVNDVGSDGSSATTDGDYWLLALGVCSDDTSKYCASNVDCGGNCTHKGDYRCAPSASSSDPVIICTVDADCSGTGTYCLADSARASALQSSLLSLANSAVTDFNQDDVATNFDTLRTDAAAFNVDQMDTDLTGIQDDITAADTVFYVQKIYDFVDSLDDNNHELFDMFNSLHTTQGKIDNMDSTALTERLDRLQEIVDNGGDKLSEYIELARDVRNYVYQGALDRRFSELSKERLLHIMNTSGFGAALMATGNTAENTVTDIRAILHNNTFHMEHVEITNFFRETATFLDRLTGNAHAGFFDFYTVGSLYYLLQLSNSTAKTMVNAHDPLQYTITTDKFGNSYPDNKVCVTRTCFENQQAELEDSGARYIRLLLIPLFIVALLAVVNLICAIRPFYSLGRGAFPKILICWIISITPFYLIGSGFLFTFLIALSDGCTGGPKIAANYIQAYGDDLCVKLDGKGTLHSCKITGNDLDITVDINHMSNVILGLQDCSGSNIDDPFYHSLNALAVQMQNSSVSSTHRRISSHRFRNFRPPVKRLVLTTVDDGAQVTHDFVQDMGDDVLTCENMQSILDYFTSPVCYSLVGPATWMVATIYLCAWTMCCLGIPAACALKNHYKWSDEEIMRRKMDATRRKTAQLEKIRIWVGKSYLTRDYYWATRRSRGILVVRRKDFQMTHESEDTDSDVEHNAPAPPFGTVSQAEDSPDKPNAQTENCKLEAELAADADSGIEVAEPVVSAALDDTTIHPSDVQLEPLVPAEQGTVEGGEPLGALKEEHTRCVDIESSTALTVIDATQTAVDVGGIYV